MVSLGRAGRRLGLLAVLLLALGAQSAPAQTVRTVVGMGNPDGLPATANPISAYHIRFDPAGNLYAMEVGATLPGSGSYVYPRIFRITPEGTIFRVAGNGLRGNPTPGAKALETSLNVPRQIAPDGNGNLYVADQSANLALVIDREGVVRILAGTGTAGFNGDGGKATEAQLSAPRGIAVDPTDGTVYIADTGNNRVRRVAPDGTISTFAGTGAVDFNALQGRATEVNLGSPRGMVVDGQGNLYIAEFNTNRIRKVTKGGDLTTVAGNGEAGVAGDGGNALQAAIGAPFDLALDAQGSLYVTQPLANVVRRVDASGGVTTIAGNGTAGYTGDGDRATAAQLNTPMSVAVGPAGQVLIADAANNRIRRVNGDGTIETVAGGAGASGLRADQVTVILPRGGVRDSAGNFYVADTAHFRVLKITPDGVASTYAGIAAPGYRGSGIKATEAGFGSATQDAHIDGLAVDGLGNLYIPDLRVHQIHKVLPDGTLVTIAGTGESGFSGDGGKATEAQFGEIWNVVADAVGNLYVADGSNHRVRKIDPNGIVTTVAGNGSETYSGDGGPAVEAGIPGPDGICLGPDNSLIITDTTDARVRKVTLSDGKITTIAGDGNDDYTGDGGPATEASISIYTENAGVDPRGNVYLADGLNNAIRVIDTNGIINTFAGNGEEGLSGDDQPLRETNINHPRDLYVDAQGNVIFAEWGLTSRIRIILVNP
jgi:sugar lactone lactonase YvrE